jgi:hypothetical protein
MLELLTELIVFSPSWIPSWMRVNSRRGVVKKLLIITAKYPFLQETGMIRESRKVDAWLQF